VCVKRKEEMKGTMTVAPAGVGLNSDDEG